jgi:hypothetical protein
MMMKTFVLATLVLAAEAKIPQLTCGEWVTTGKGLFASVDLDGERCLGMI